MYEELVLDTPYVNIWIPKGYNVDHMGKRVRDSKYLYLDPKLDGNTVLIQKPDGKMLYIGVIIYEFELNKDDSVVDYYSLVGPNDVPYPVLVGRQAVYFMEDNVYVPMTYFGGLIDEKEFINAYAYFYGHEGSRPLKDFAKKMDDVNILASGRGE